MHTYIHTYIHTHIHTYRQTDIHTYIPHFKTNLDRLKYHQVHGSYSVRIDMSVQESFFRFCRKFKIGHWASRTSGLGLGERNSFPVCYRKSPFSRGKSTINGHF